MPVPEVNLNSVSVDIEYANTPVSGLLSNLWLARDLTVRMDLKGRDLSEEHKYSKYRAFRVQTRMLVNP